MAGIALAVDIDPVADIVPAEGTGPAAADFAVAGSVAVAADTDSDPEQRWELLQKRQPTNLPEKR